MAVVKICIYEKCNKEFIPDRKGMKYCCPKCRYEANCIRVKEKEKRRREEKAKKKAEISKRLTRAELEREARKVGMHYGMYVALMEAKKGVQG